MLAWQMALIGFSSLYVYNALLSSSKESIQIDESTLSLIGISLLGSMCVILVIYILFGLCLFSNIICHIIAGWILLLLLSLSYWQHQDFQKDYLFRISFYLSIGLLVFIHQTTVVLVQQSHTITSIG